MSFFIVATLIAIALLVLVCYSVLVHICYSVYMEEQEVGLK